MIWEEVKLAKVKATHPQGVVEDKSNEGEAGEDVAYRDQRHHCLADERRFSTNTTEPDLSGILLTNCYLMPTSCTGYVLFGTSDAIVEVIIG